MSNTKIEWTDKSWNPVRGCTRVSHGCEHCYAERQAHRFSGSGQPYEGLTEIGPKGPRWNGKIRLVPELLEEPLRWRKPCRVFVNSMSDLFHEAVPDRFISEVFAVMNTARRHTFQVLTKRPERMLRLGTDQKLIYAMSNVWLGVSVEDQKTADERIPLLLQTPAAVRFVSAEPLLSHIDLSKWLSGNKPHDGIRKSVSCVRCGRDFLDRSERENLEAPAAYSREPRRRESSALLERFGETGTRREVFIGRLSNGNVLRQETLAQGLCPSCCLDASKQTRHPERNADQPQERGSRRHEASEPGTYDSIAECDPRDKGFGAEAKSTRGGEECVREANGDRRLEDSGVVRKDVSIADRQDVRSQAGHGLGDSGRQELGASGISWVICGGESGPGARPSHPDWFRSARDQCQAAGVPFLFKQWGEWEWITYMDGEQPILKVSCPTPERMKKSTREIVFDGVNMRRVGKKAAGRLLDGKEHNAFPA